MNLPVSPSSPSSSLLFITVSFIRIMAQITYTQLAVILCAFCFITQVLSQSTDNPNNSTVPGNQTANANITVTSGASGSPTNATSPTGTGVQFQANTLSVLISVAMTTGLLQHWC